MEDETIGLNLSKAKHKGLIIIAILGISINSFCQKKSNFSVELGSGIQIVRTNIVNSKYVKFNPNLTPKPFLGVGFNLNINKQVTWESYINSNLCSFETEIKYHNDTDNISYFSRLRHNDFNYGFATGIKYIPNFKDNRFFMSGGLKFQKISIQSYFSDYSLYGGNDSALSTIYEVYNSNDMNKKYNSFGFYLNLGFIIGKKRSFELLFESEGSVNKPIFGSNEIYYNNKLIEKASYKRNIIFAIFKIRKNF